MEGKSNENPALRAPGSCRRAIGDPGPPRRVYQVWKGNNRFLLSGRLIFGPDVRSLVLTVFLIIVPVILFTVFVAQKLVTEFEHKLGDLIVSLAVIFTIYILFLLFFTSGIDPGIIPRNLHPPEPEEDDDYSSMPTNCAGSQSRVPTLPPTKDVVVNGAIVKIKYCNTCMLYRPPRCSHCSICNNCVERFDHHCPWVGQCIGKRNYRFFFMFVSATTVLCLYVFAFCWVNLKKIMISYQCNLWKAIVESPVSGILILYTFVAVWFVGGLTAFHTYLICTNQTTYENFRYRYDRKSNPYNLGCPQNVKEIFFSMITKSRNNFRAKVDEEDKAVFNASLSMDRTLSPDIAKTSIDLEAGGKRQAVAAEELEDIQNQMENVRGSDRCGTQPEGSSGRGGVRDSSEITPDLQALAAELGMQHGPTDREKVTGDTK